MMIQQVGRSIVGGGALSAELRLHVAIAGAGDVVIFRISLLLIDWLHSILLTGDAACPQASNVV